MAAQRILCPPKTVSPFFPPFFGVLKNPQYRPPNTVPPFVLIPSHFGSPQEARYWWFTVCTLYVCGVIKIWLPNSLTFCCWPFHGQKLPKMAKIQIGCTTLYPQHFTPDILPPTLTCLARADKGCDVTGLLYFPTSRR